MNNAALPKTAKLHLWPKRIAVTLAIALAAGAACFGAYVSDYYRAQDTSTLLSDAKAVSVEENDESIAIAPPGSLEGESSAKAGLILYPGAKVDPHAYVPLAEKIAERGYICVIAKMPFNLAFFGIDAASGIMDNYPQTDSWWIAGHSLGGVAAAQYAASHADVLEGIAFLASYPVSDLSETDLHALSAYGSQDLVLNRESLAENATKLPANTKTVAIEGGNHAGFGAYGPQKGDGEAAISADEQQEAFANAFDAAAGADRQ